MAEEILETVEKVCNFLRARGLSDEVIAKFQHEKMDVSAILNADDDCLKDMGIVKAGDRLSLRGFCTSSTKSDEEDTKSKKRSLLEAFLAKKKGKKSGPIPKGTQHISSSHNAKPEKMKTKKVQLGWKHYKEIEEAYVLVPLAKGGGSRQVELPLSTTKRDLMKVCKTLFFPNGKSPYGKEEEMAFDLGNFKNEKIGVTVRVEGKELPFNLNNYIEAHKIKNVRLYLCSQKLFDYSSDEGDNTDAIPTIDVDNTEEQSALIGSTEERQALMLEQDFAFEEALNVDKQKRIQLASEATEHDRKIRIQLARAARVLPEPDSNFVSVKVRHLTMGVCSRQFPCDAKMSAVYDWAGSLSPETENFTLYDPFGEILLPSTEISDRCTISMVETSETPPISESDNEVQFQGFGDTSSCSVATLPDAGDQSRIGEEFSHLANREAISQLDDYYASLLHAVPSTSNARNTSFSDSDRDEDIVEEIPPVQSPQSKNIEEILCELAKAINDNCISKFNISRSFLWEGAKRALSRKSFSPANRISVKFTDDAGVSEGAVDLGGPMREFFTLTFQYLHDSQLFCGHENCKFLSFLSKCVDNDDYFSAGVMFAMSIVHGGPGLQFLSPAMFEALFTDLHKIVVPVEDVYDKELQASLQTLLNSATTEDAMHRLDEGNLLTVLDLAGTLMPVQVLDDVVKMVDLTTRWFVLGRAQPALESFQRGLSVLGVLDSIKVHPEAFRSVLCHEPKQITAEIMENLFTVMQASPVGSTKAVTESLVLSRWRDYLQDIEEGEDSIALRDILFFATGCKVLPPRKIYPSIEFLHGAENWGQSRFPTANTCSSTLRLPVVHTTYESFKADMTFGIQNGRGFGTA